MARSSAGRACGVRRGTRSCRELPQIIDGLGLAGFFDAIVSSALVGYEKPRPELFAAARALTQDDGAVWMVGDNPDADCSGAVRFGVNAVLVRTATGFDPRIDDLFALESVLREG